MAKRPKVYEVWTAKNNPYGSKGKYISQFHTKKEAEKYMRRNKPVRYKLKKIY